MLYTIAQMHKKWKAALTRAYNAKPVVPWHDCCWRKMEHLPQRSFASPTAKKLPAPSFAITRSSACAMPVDAPNDPDVLVNQLALHSAQQNSAVKAFTAQFGDSDGEDSASDSDSLTRERAQEEQLNVRTSCATRPTSRSTPQLTRGT